MRWMLLITACAALCGAGSVAAEQKQRLGPFDAHYSVVPTTFFSPAIAERYGIVRGRDRGLVNVTIVRDDAPQQADISGTVTNLLGQRTALTFREVREGDAVYYLAPIRYSDRETLRFRVRIVSGDGVERLLEFQQQMFWDDR